jgi:nicotinamide phosphoribosyltransferase
MIDSKFCVSNLVVGIGSYTQQMVSRDTLKQAFKATAVKINGELIEIYKDPKTDTSGKKSAKGLLKVDYNENGVITLYDQVSEEEEKTGLLETIFINGKLIKEYSLTEIRNTVNN